MDLQARVPFLKTQYLLNHTHEMRNDFVQSGRGLQPSRLQNEGWGMQTVKLMD